MQKNRSIILTTTITLYLLGLILILIFNRERISMQLKEQVTIALHLQEGSSSEEVSSLIINCKKFPEIKSVRYISGEVVMVDIDSRYSSPAQIESVKSKLISREVVTKVSTPESVVETLNKNIKKVSVTILTFATLVTLISIVLIVNTVRGAISNKKVEINTMKLIGATPRYIIGPYILKGVVNGVIGGVISTILIILTAYYFGNYISYSTKIVSNLEVIYIGVILMLVGTVTPSITSLISVSRYLRMRTDKIFN